MTSVCHVFDGSTGWEQRTSATVLLDRLPTDRFSQTLAGIDASAKFALAPMGQPLRVLHRALPINALAAAAVARLLRRECVDVIHAWGIDAAGAARAATDRPVVLELFDPAEATRRIKLVRTLSESPRFGIVCSCEIVRRRLVEGGVPLGRCAVVRPGIDFAYVNRVKRGPLRDELGMSRGGTLVVLPLSTARNDRAFDAFWAGSLRNHLDADVAVVVPGCGKDALRISRFAKTAPSRPTIARPGEDHRIEDLICVADVVMVATDGDVSTTAIAWAMAAGAAVIGSAVPAVAELIAHKVNGLLYNPKVTHGPVVAMARLLADRIAQAKVREVARGQAYEVFGLRRRVEQHVRVYENLLRGQAPGAGIADSAQSA